MLKKILITLAIVMMSFSAQAGVKIEHWLTKSGTRVYFVENHTLPILDVQLDFEAGNTFDPIGQSGVAALTQALMDSGTKDLNEEQIASRLANTGALLAGSVDLDRASFSLRTLTDAASQAEQKAALTLLQAVLQAPSFPDTVLNREKIRTIAAIQEADTRPEGIAAKRFMRMIYPNHPYGVQTTVPSVTGITRMDLVAFHQTHYGAKQAIVSMIGDISHAQAEAIAEQLTQGLPKPHAAEPLPAITWPEREIVRIPHPATQAHILMGLPGVRRGDPDFFPLLVGNYVFGGGGFVSRLIKEVREKRGYAYDAHSYFQAFKLEGPFQIGLQTKRDQAQAALKVVESSLADFLRTGPTETELEAAKHNLADGFALRIDSNHKILEYLALIAYYNLPLSYLDDFPLRVREVTTQQVRDAFARHVQPEHIVTVVVGGE